MILVVSPKDVPLVDPATLPRAMSPATRSG